MRHVLPRLLSTSAGNLSGAHVMATLAWVDAVERLDILIMEIRHIQSNIIQLLRKPRLLNLLRFEEIFIWGTVGTYRDKAEPARNQGGRKGANGQPFPDWIDLFRVLDDSVDTLPRLSSFFVLSIDSRSKRDRGNAFNETPWLKDHSAARLALIKSVSNDVERSLFSSNWGQEHRRNYHLFRALQRMKRNLVLAKLQLCWWGSWAFRMIGGSGAPSILDKRLAHFIAVRAGVMVKLSEAVARLSDLQDQFERSLDLGPQQVARPLGGRRRHGALSATFLHNRSHQLWLETHQLLTILGVNESDPKEVRPLTTHRWQHDTLSSSHVIFDDTIVRRHVDDNPVSAIDFLNSSYWAPDRPDLQIMIAHEAAAAALGQRLPLTDRMQLSAGSGPFADLLRTLNHAIVHHSAVDPSPMDRGAAPDPTAKTAPPSSGNDGDITDILADDQDSRRHFDLSSSFARAKRDLLPVLAADLLATSIHGAAYIFALFQTSFGQGMEQLFRLPSGQVDLGIASEAWTLSHLNDEVPLDWFVRIKLVCAWARAVQFDQEHSQLGITLVQGIEALSDQLLGRIRTLYDGEAREWPVLWHKLTLELCHIVAKSPVTSAVRDWRYERLKPYERSSSRAARPTLRRTTRSSRPMPPDLANFLKRVLITRKCTTAGRGLHREIRRKKDAPVSFDRAVALFNHLYLQNGSQPSAAPADELSLASGSKPPGVQGNTTVTGTVQNVVKVIRDWQKARRTQPGDRGLDELGFFRSLHDIPWEAAIMRACDFLDDLEHRHDRAAGLPCCYGPIASMSLDFQPGRETFQVAFEFQLLLTKRPADRLHNSLGLVNRIQQMFSQTFDDEGLKRWYNGDTGSGAEPSKGAEPSANDKDTSIKAQLERWTEGSQNDDTEDAGRRLVLDINTMAELHRDGTCTDVDVLDWCRDIAASAPVKRLLNLGGSIQRGQNAHDVKLDLPPAEADGRSIKTWVSSSAMYVLNRIQHVKLEQLAEIMRSEVLADAGIETRQHDHPDTLPVGDKADWKAIDFIITLNKYLELNSSAKLRDDERDGFDDLTMPEKRVRSRAMILHALNCFAQTERTENRLVDGGLAIDVHEIGYLSISEAREEGELHGPDEEDVDGHRHRLRRIYEPPHRRIRPFATRDNVAHKEVTDHGLVWPEATYAACLGRFDRIVFSDSHPVLTHQLPRFPRLDDLRDERDVSAHGNPPDLGTLSYAWDVPVLDEDGTANDLEAFSGFVQQRETALRIKLTTGEPPDADLVPLAMVSVGLIQRYSRLEFIGRILQAIYHKPKIGAYTVDGIYHLLKDGDQAYLTDGAYDMTIVIMGPRTATEDEHYDRFRDVLHIGMTLHGDFMVERTETHMLVPMLNGVLAKDSTPLSIVQEIRLKESARQQFSYRLLFEDFERHVAEQNDKIKDAWNQGTKHQAILPHIDVNDAKELERIQPKMYIIPGRADVAVWYTRDWLKIFWALYPEKAKLRSGLLDGLMSMVLRDRYVDRVATTIGVDPEGLLNWKS